MNKIVIKYILSNFFKSFLIFSLVIFCFGVILNLFEEIEFFKNVNISIVKPIMLTALFVPSLILKLLPFIIFFSSMWFIVKIRNNNDLLIMKILLMNLYQLVQIWNYLIKNLDIVQKFLLKKEWKNS